MTNVVTDARTLSDIVIQGLQEIKGRQIVRMNMNQADGAVCDYFVLCTGTSDKHVQALAESVEKFVKDQAAEKPHSREGFQKGEWVLLDYVNVVVHIFQAEARNFFRLEDLWGDATFDRFEDL
ncbi:MAG: ribosome silencing factor [Bacteroidetes bacterium]|nr:MAG: ribosome silencing factor [Bacteroidota bacterium]